MKKLISYSMIIILSILFVRCKDEKVSSRLSFVSFEYEMPTNSIQFPQKYPIHVKLKYIFNVHNTTTDTLKVRDMVFFETINNHQELMRIDTAFKQLGIRPTDSIWVAVYSNKPYNISNSSINFQSVLNTHFRSDNKYIKLSFRLRNQLSPIELNNKVRILHNPIDPYTKKFINRPSIFWIGMKDERLDTNAMYYINLKKRANNTSKMLIVK